MGLFVIIFLICFYDLLFLTCCLICRGAGNITVPFRDIVTSWAPMLGVPGMSRGRTLHLCTFTPFNKILIKKASRPCAADLKIPIFIIFIRTLKPPFSTISLRLKTPDPSKNHQHLLPHLFRPISKNRFFQHFIKSKNLNFRPSEPYSDHFWCQNRIRRAFLVYMAPVKPFFRWIKEFIEATSDRWLGSNQCLVASRQPITGCFQATKHWLLPSNQSLVASKQPITGCSQATNHCFN